MAPRFLASAFASGPALLIIFCLILRRYGRFDAGEKAIQALAKIVAYALAVSIFFILVELFTAFYSQIPEHMRHFQYLFAGLDGYHKLVSWMWASAALAFVALAMLIIPPVRRKEGWLAIACVFVFVSLWIEKGLGLVIPGFIPSPLEAVTEYMPTGTEIGITLGVWTLGLLLITLFYKIFVSVRNEG
jgi:molybdopterin-containing oxidoreductase family membrane subunit